MAIEETPVFGRLDDLRGELSGALSLTAGAIAVATTTLLI
jgi:hypothetical protein